MGAPSVAVVGLGSMGSGMADNIRAAGIDVVAHDISEPARERFRAAGGAVAPSAAEAARAADVLVLMVVDAAQAAAVLFGADGVVSTLPRASVVMLCCTIAPGDVVAICDRLAVTGHMWLDAPVSGGRTGAESGNLTIMASGSPDAFARAEPVLDAVATKVYRLGDRPGLGATYKVVHQLAAGVHLAAAAEVMAFGAKAGCDPHTLFEIVSRSSGQSWMLTDRVPHMLDDDFRPRSTVDIFVKDLGLVIDTARDVRMPLPLGASAHQQFLAASAAGFGAIDDAGVVKVYELMAGAPLAQRLATSSPEGGEG